MDTRLPSAIFCDSSRVDTGTIARIERFAVDTPRAISARRNVPATPARMTSFTVPPSAFFTAFASATGTSVKLKRRLGPIGTLNGLGGAIPEPICCCSAPSTLPI